MIQPFTGAKEDDARFLRTLADLEDNPRLIFPDFTIHVSQVSFRLSSSST
jgi:hypothetical protein